MKNQPTRRLALCLLFLALATPGDAWAQAFVYRPSVVETVSPVPLTGNNPMFSHAGLAGLQSQTGAPAQTATLLAGGALAAGVSGALGAVIGYHVTRHEGGEDPGMSGLATGWLAGPALVTPIVVHALNDGRGSLTLSYGVAAGLVLASVLTMDTPVIFITSPALQVIAAAVVQRVTGH